MIKQIATKFAVTVAAAGLALSPIAAQANTRAGDSGSIYGAEASSAGAIFGAVYDDDDEVAGLWGRLSGVIAGLLAATVIIGVLSIADDSDDQSPGT
ncbi:hypothetical protein FGU71_07065 [Erythrobacter insulae]|uniref:Uncharacterized protein n=1 Tax=Erythrobacter insulae TaxID=2584124 RepID=A0A547PBY4_9SPHN|nr:hypothetical protein [Erythrobacter insulae]TRD11648.1 hypothetical protein FGU71_07065 [Erythrobacter insulae]